MCSSDGMSIHSPSYQMGNDMNSCLKRDFHLKLDSSSCPLSMSSCDNLSIKACLQLIFQLVTQIYKVTPWVLTHQSVG